MKTIQCGIKCVYGIPTNAKEIPIKGAPFGRTRLRLRNDSAAKLFIKTESSIRCFVLEDRGDHWFCNPKLEKGANHRC